MDSQDDSKRIKRSRSKSQSRESSRERVRRRRSRSRSRNYRKSRSISPYRGGRGGFRGGSRRFARRSPPPFRGGGRGFRDRFRDRRSRSSSRGRYERRRYDQHDHRRSRSASPPAASNEIDNNYQQHAQHQTMGYGSDAYGNYVPQFPGSMAQFNSYDFQGTYPATAVAGFGMNQMSACPAPPGLTDWQPQAPLQPSENEEEKKRREAAIAEEKKRQREGLKTQRDSYINRSEKMKRELKVLREQKDQLMNGLNRRSPSPKTNGFIKENEKLQSQISSKLSEIGNVIEMLSGIIGKDSDHDEDGKKSSDDSSPERIKSELLESMKRKKKEAEEKSQKINYIYYDPELHWCKACQVFPKTAQDYLNHLHSKEHLEKLANRKSEAPWRPSFQKANEVPSYPDAPTKRAQIKGLQFFEPTTAWFCKLCEVFMGDSWCTSLHLKSSIHAERYAKFIEKEPKFEEKWLEARTKALESFGPLKVDSIKELKNEAKSQSAAMAQEISEKKSKKKKSKKDSKKKRKRGKKRKHSSSSSDSEDNSDSSSSTSDTKKSENNQSADNNKNSIRIAMRNMQTKDGGQGTGWTKVGLDPNKPPIPPPPAISSNASKESKKDEQIIGQWNSVEPIISQEEKRLLQSLKGRLKQKDVEKQVDVPPPPNVSSRKASRSRSKDRERRNYRGKKSRSKSRKRSISPRRRSRSRSRNRHGGRNNRYGGRGRYSRSRSRSRSSSYHRVRPGIPVYFPEEPKLPPLREEKKQPARSYVITKKDPDLNALANASKKMPIIGKMPVYKKQLVDKKVEEKEEPKKEEMTTHTSESLDEQNRHEDWNDLMPDPLQFSAMMNSAAALNPPPPPIINEEPDAPPGLDPEMDSEFIPKAISDAPLLRKGPLPSDFQATLDLLFDGDKPKPLVIEPVMPVEIPIQQPLPIMTNDGPQMINAEELRNYYQTSDVQPVPPPPSIPLPENPRKSKNDEKMDEKNDSGEQVEEDSDEKMKNQEDMDDLAMLGIDVNDVGSGLW